MEPSEPNLESLERYTAGSDLLDQNQNISTENGRVGSGQNLGNNQTMRGKAKLKKTTLSKQSQLKEPLLPIALLDLENTLRTEMHELVFPLKEKLTQYESNLKDIHGLVPKDQKLDLA